MYAISAINAFIHDIDSYLELATDITDRIALTVVYINDVLFVEGTKVNLSDNDLFKCVDTTRSFENTRFIKQRTDEWFEIGKSVKVIVQSTLLHDPTGYTGFNTILTILFAGSNKKNLQSAQDLQIGTDNEVNAVATIIGKVKCCLFFPPS